MNPPSQTYRVGDAAITRLVDLESLWVDPHALYPELDADTLAAHRRHSPPGSYEPRTGQILQSFHSWLVRLPGRTILVDTGVGNDKDVPAFPPVDHRHSPFLERLAAAGVRPGEVDTVFLTHVHADHVGWNTRLVDGRWVPTFPNARHVFSRVEERYNATAGGEGIPDLPPPALGVPTAPPLSFVYDQSVAPVVAAGLADLIDVDGTERPDGFSFLPTPGHSVDHASIRLRSRGEEALFTGDVFHHPVQVDRPDLRSAYAEFPESARASRRWLLEYAAEQGCLCLTAHFGETAAGYVRRDGDGFRWQFA